MLCYIDWQPSIEAFSIGSITVRWYSLCWCAGLLLAYLIVQHLYKQQGIEEKKFEPLFFYCILGVLIGARLGHCIFYEWSYYLSSFEHFVEMLIPFHKTPSGWVFTGYEGLASHGGTIGLFLALLIYWKKYKLKAFTVLDNIAIAVPVTACLIRLGNLMNSEIIGNQTEVAWAFLFHNREALVNGEVVPRHPAQLYEAIAYLIIFVAEAIIYWKWYKSSSQSKTSATAVGTGFYFGFCLATIFIFRFFVEFLKKEQVAFEEEMMLDMGQILSIPMIIAGVWCMIKAKKQLTVNS